MVSLRIAAFSSSLVISSPSRYFIISSSSPSATVSMRMPLYSSAWSFMSAGISTNSSSFPISSPYTMACMRIRSTMPRKSSSTPIGTCRATGFAFRRSRIMSMTWKKSAPTMSILLTYAIRGTLYSSAWRHTVSDWGSTPPLAENTAMVPSSTRRDRSTSTVKSTWPGVSMMLIRCVSYCFSEPSHMQVVAAEVMVIPRSCSCTIQSMVAAPS